MLRVDKFYFQISAGSHCNQLSLIGYRFGRLDLIIPPNTPLMHKSKVLPGQS